MSKISSRIAQLLGVRIEQINAAVTLLDQGDTVPFISRYRKEVTGGLDDSQMRQLEDRLRYFRELEDRRASILSSIDEQGKLSDELRTLIEAAETKTTLEDLYLPYKKKRRTKGQIAIEAGLESLVTNILERKGSLEDTAAPFVCETYPDTKACLDGAKFILMERWAELPELLGKARTLIAKQAHLVSKVISGKESEGAKYRDYFDHHELCATAPSHRALAMLRGRNEGILALSLTLPELIDAPLGTEHPVETMIHRICELNIDRSEHGTWLKEVARWCWKIKLSPHIDTDVFNELRQRAEQGAIDVFSSNLRDLLLAAPAGARATIGLDPGLRTGVKVAVTPTINAQGIVSMVISQENSNQVDGGTSVEGNPSIFDRSITTEVVAESGQTVILGGLISENVTNNGSAVPFLGSLPVVGGLFGTKTDNKTKTELVIMVTPRIVESSSQWDDLKARFSQGLEHVKI